MIRAVLCLVALLLVPVAALHATEPRAVVERVAAAIEREYFDAGRGSEIAGALRKEAARGDFDRFSNPQELATALTTRLKAQDRHFNVRWSANAGQAAPAARGPSEREESRNNFGIRRVEILPGNVGYLDLRYFADFDYGVDPSQAPARQAIDAALQVLGHVDALLIDLRDNGGGSPAMVGYLASAFVAPDADIYNRFRSREGTTSEAPAQPYPAPRTQLPLYLLVSGRTGSAAEAFAYTLKNAKRATLVGQATGGAANPGRPFGIGGGFSVFVSTGSPVSPISGGNWEGTGVVPDVETAAADALAKAQQLALALLVEHGAGEHARWSLDALIASAPPVAPAALAALAGDYGAVRVTAADGALILQQGRRPPLRLRPLSEGLFFVDGEPTRRVRFERQQAGRSTALELMWADGQVARHVRGEDGGP